MPDISSFRVSEKFSIDKGIARRTIKNKKYFDDEYEADSKKSKSKDKLKRNPEDIEVKKNQ